MKKIVTAVPVAVSLAGLAGLALVAFFWEGETPAGRVEAADREATMAGRVPGPPAPVEPVRPGVSAFAGFSAWLAAFRRAPAEDRGALAGEGIARAAARRDAMKDLIRHDPQRALAEEVPYELRQDLPREVTMLLEEPVRATGEFAVIITCGLGRGGSGRTEHFVLLSDGRRLQAFPYGRRLDVTTKRGISLHGIAVDDVMAVADDPVRVIPEGERTARGLHPDAVEVGGRIYRVDNAKTLARLRETLRRDEMTLGPRHLANYAALEVNAIEGVVAITPGGGEAPPAESGAPPPPPSAHTEGPKTMLYIRARFADQDPSFEPIALSTLQTRQGSCEQFWSDNSYGASSLTTTFTDTVTLTINAPPTTDDRPGLGTILADARSAAVAADSEWNYTHFDFYTVLTSGGSFGYAGVAFVGGTGSHLNGSGAANVRTASHEFGHNLGLRHANYWRTDSPSPIGRDGFPGYRGDASNDEWVQYGHKFSVMSAQAGGGDIDSLRGHYTPGEKVKINWLKISDWTSVNSSGLVRVYRHDIPEIDHPAMTLGVARAIKINLGSDDYVNPSNRRRYWLTYRWLPTNGIAETWLRHGLQVDWQRNTYGSDGSIQLDMTPFSRDSTTVGGNWTTDNNDKEDAALVVGRTYTDAARDIHFTPVAQGGSNPNEWIDVQVHVGTQGANGDPEITSFQADALTVGTGVNVNFSVAATDPDGDTMAYSWDFADNSLVEGALNSATATKSWGSAGQYVVRATVSDMKGGTDTKDLLITVGNPSNVNYITGRVLHGGLPVEGARVNIGSSHQTWTEGDGTYTLAGLPSGSHTVTAARLGLTFSPQFTNPVNVTDLNIFGIDFHANEGLTGGGITMAVTPYEVEVLQGMTVQFSANGWDSSGNPVSTNPAWSISGGGTIDTGGLFTADTGGGPYVVTATDGAASATATVIVTEVAGVGITVTDGEASEAGPDSGMMRIGRFGDTTESITVQLVVGGSATEGADYAAISTAVPIGAGVAFADVPVVPIDDFEAEGDETVVITLQPDPSYVVSAGELSGTITIADDGDAGPVVSIISPFAPITVVPSGTGLLLLAVASDDGLPNPPGALSARWSIVTAPPGGSVTFTPPDARETVANFGVPGRYVLRLTSSDGPNSSFAEVTVVAGVSGGIPSGLAEEVYYDFDEGAGTTANDLRGGDDSGTLVNGATWSAPGIMGSAVLLDGIDDQVDIADSFAINLGEHPLRTVAFWFKADDPNKVARQVLYEEGGTSGGLNIYLEAGILYVGGWNDGVNGWSSTFLSTPATDTVWHHVALVLDAPGSGLQSDAFAAYLDGSLYASGDGAAINEHVGDISIGARRDGSKFHDSSPSGSGDHFGGVIDEFHLWNRALTAIEIAQLYAWSGTGVPELSLTSLDAGVGSVVIPSGVGVVLDGVVPGGIASLWRQVTAPAGGSVTFEDAAAPGTTATFSAPGFYGLRLIAGGPDAVSAIAVNVHAGIDAPANPAPANGVIYFALDEGSGTTATDAIGGDDNGTLAGGAGWTESGVAGSAVSFDGIDDVIEISSAQNLNTGAAHNQKTIALWFKEAAAGSGAKVVLYEQGDATRGLNIYLENGVIYVGGWNDGVNGWNSTYLGAPVTAGQWHHVVLVLDVPTGGSLAGDGLRMFLDGVMTGSGEAAEMSIHTGNIGLGGMRNGSRFHDGEFNGDGLHFAGEIDEFHYFNGRVLTIDEIGRIYAFGNIGAAVNAGLDEPGTFGLAVNLGGSSSDDGRWTGSLGHAWSVVGGPGTAVFSDPDAAGIDSVATFPGAGSYVLRLAADDGQVTTFDETVVNLNTGYYADWVVSFPGFGGPAAEYLANPDGDLMANVIEYAFGGDPTRVEGVSGILPSAGLRHDAGEEFVEFTFRRRRDAGLRGLTYAPERTIDLAAGPWTTEGITVQGTTIIDAEFEEVTVRISDPVSAAAPRGFIRVAIGLDE